MLSASFQPTAKLFRLLKPMPAAFRLLQPALIAFTYPHDHCDRPLGRSEPIQKNELGQLGLGKL